VLSSAAVTASATHHAITAVWKSESARLVGGLVRIVRDVGLAEELAQDALVAALEEWPSSGVPERPSAWLMTTAKNRALNAVRHARMADRKHEAIGHEIDTHLPLAEIEAAIEAWMDDDVGDDTLRLVFTACHPVLSREARVALTLRLVGGLSTDEIARAFLVAEPTIAQRIVRAKRTLADARIAYEVPRGEALGARLSSVLEVVYLVFNEGYTATAGDEVMRPALAGEALRLGRLLAGLAPAEPEVLGLLSLMELSASRGPARTDANGEPVLLPDQDRTRWDAALVEGGLSTLARAEALGGEPGPYRLQASIAACHARARSAADTDWARIAARYEDLARCVPSPVVELNRAVAVSRAEGPVAGLALLDAIASEAALARYPFLPAARADLLAQLGRHAEASAEFERAASLTQNTRQRERLLERAAACRRAAQH
jgi:RNA polymerase sigma factor (sigma-70 family)